MKRIVITGASGLIATELTLLLLQYNEYELYLISTHPEKYKDRYESDKVKWYNIDELKRESLELCKRFDVIIHAGFSRSSDGADVASSLQFTESIVKLALTLKISSFINISSQSVYGKKYPPLWTESTPVAPDYMYALGKYASELIVNNRLKDSGVNYTNLRLSSVCENARFLRVFVQNALSDQPIKVIGGQQLLSFIDVRDVAEALKVMIDKSGLIKFDEVYNLSTSKTNTILSMAEMVKVVGKEIYNINPEVEVQKEDIDMKVGMDSTKFQQVFGWHPKYDLRAMIDSLYKYLKINNIDGGGILDVGK